MSSNNQQPALLIVAPNGARATQLDHPALPITPDELAETAFQCAAAGAAMIHLHARDWQGKHSLAIRDNSAAVAAVRERVGDQMIIQVTTEAIGRYTADEQMSLIRELVPEATSLALRELVPDAEHEAAAAEFFAWIKQSTIIAQYILYSQNDVARYFDLRQNGIIPDHPHHVLVVLGRYHDSQPSSPMAIEPLVRDLQAAGVRWALCAFGRQESVCLQKALQLGGDARVGFENNHFTHEGLLAVDNAQQVAIIAALATAEKRPLHTADSFRNAIMQSAYNSN